MNHVLYSSGSFMEFLCSVGETHLDTGNVHTIVYLAYLLANIDGLKRRQVFPLRIRVRTLLKTQHFTSFTDKPSSSTST